MPCGEGKELSPVFGASKISILQRNVSSVILARMALYCQFICIRITTDSCYLTTFLNYMGYVEYYVHIVRKNQDMKISGLYIYVG
jgi:hypothetical protein